METLIKNFILFLFAFTCVFLAIPSALLWRLFRKSQNERSDYFLKLAINFDYVGGTILYDTDARTVSAVTGKLSFEENRMKGFEKFINWLFGDSDHCHSSYVNEFKITK